MGEKTKKTLPEPYLFIDRPEFSRTLLPLQRTFRNPSKRRKRTSPAPAPSPRTDGKGKGEGRIRRKGRMRKSKKRSQEKSAASFTRRYCPVPFVRC